MCLCNASKVHSVDSLSQYEMTSHLTRVHLRLRYTWWSFKRAFTAGPLIHHLLLLQTSASSSLSAAEAAAQCSVGTVEEIGDRHSRRQMATLCSLGAVCHYTILKPLIQHSLGLNAGLLQGLSWQYTEAAAYKLSSSPPVSFSNVPFSVFPL